MDIEAGGYTLRGLSKVNVVIGKNGCGKSTMLKAVDGVTGDEIGRKKYVTPERGGVLVYEPNVENNIVNDPLWMPNARRVNQFAQFKQQSTAQFRRLETLVFREAEAKEVADFQPYVDRLNGLLDNIELRRADPTFKLYDRASGNEVIPANISSGESELISLGIEILMFAKDQEPDKWNVLLLDEPDVHLHPDLQNRLTQFLCAVVDEYGFHVVIATHSTPMLGSLANYTGATVSFMESGDHELDFEAISEVHRRVLPVFGAHPLSNVFNEAPVLVVEGEDDERVWQQAVRTANGNLQLYPVPCEGVSEIGAYEQEVDRIVSSVYDNGQAYSLRDGDGVQEELDDQGVVCRLRLKCRSAENLMLTNEVLERAGISTDDVKTKTEEWLEANPQHVKHAAMSAFRDSNFDRKNCDLKEVRNILIGQILGSTKAWEVLVGQVLGSYAQASASAADSGPGSIADFLGPKAVAAIFK